MADPPQTRLPPGPNRLATGVPGLDPLLGGGLLQGGLYLIEGVAGAGKTVLASQLASHFAQQGRKALMVTLLAESHGKLLQHVGTFEFFDAALVPDGITLLSGLPALVDGGVDGLGRFLAETMHQHRCQLLVLDGFATVRAFSDDTRSLSRFIYQLNTLVSTLGATALLLGSPSEAQGRPEDSLVDGVIELQRVSCGLRRAREIEVHKMRGGAHLTGQHLFDITGDGVRVYPRLESLPAPVPGTQKAQGGRMGTGIATLDTILGGGVVPGSATSLLGAPGVGKTLMGLSFLAEGARQGRKTLYFGLYEAPSRLAAKARGVGLDLDPLVQSGSLILHWHAALELNMDAMAQELLHVVRAQGVEQVFIDGVEGFAQAAFHPERLSRFLTALTVQLRALGVTIFLAEELPLFVPGVVSRLFSLSAIVENALLLRFFERDSQLRRLFTVIKLRDSDFDPGIREFEIGSQGITVRDEVLGVDQVLMGPPHAGAAPAFVVPKT
jgi:circadian clock protein KaiC